MDGGSDAAAERAVDAATVALSPYEFFRVHEDPLGERPTFGAGPTAAAARLHQSDRPKVLVCRSTKAYRRLASCVPISGEKTVDIGSAYGDATALMAQAAGKGAVLGIDVSKHFVDQSSASRPDLRFERLDALEDPALLAREIEGAVNVFVDIGGVRAAEALVRLLPAVAKSASPHFIVVKCEALHDAMADAEVPFPGLAGATTVTRFSVPEREREEPPEMGTDDDYETDGSDSRWVDAVVVTASGSSTSFWRKTCEREVSNVRARSAFKRAHVAKSARPASELFARYPLKYPPRFVAGDVEICRFHNYAAEGCIRRVKFGMCMFDHDHCHWCGHHGHRAWECEHAVKAHQSAVVDEGLVPAAQPVRDPNDGTGVTGAMNGTVNGVDDLLHHRDFFLDAADGSRPDGFHQLHCPLGRTRHAVLEAPLGVVVVAEEFDALVAALEDFRDQGVIVELVVIVAARIVGFPDLLAQLALVRVGQERIHRRAGVQDRIFTFMIALGRQRGRRGDEGVRQAGELVFRQVENVILFVGQHVVRELGVEFGQALVDRGVTLGRLALERRTVAREVVLGQLNQALLVRTQLAHFVRIVDSFDALEEVLVLRDLAEIGRQPRRHFLLNLAEFRRRQVG